MTAKRDGGPCTNPHCGVGRMRETPVTWTEGNEIKVLYTCDECGHTETRNPEPPQSGDGE